MFFIGIFIGSGIGIFTMCLLQIGSENKFVITKERLVQEIEGAERTIQSIIEFNDIGGTQTWWQGRQALAEQLLKELEDENEKER